jgi:hypothetical protein
MSDDSRPNIIFKQCLKPDHLILIETVTPSKPVVCFTVKPEVFKLDEIEKRSIETKDQGFRELSPKRQNHQGSVAFRIPIEFNQFTCADSVHNHVSNPLQAPKPLRGKPFMGSAPDSLS